MASAELKENGKRVRHCFPRKEVYHRWIHDDTYVYNSKSYRLSGKYDLLFGSIINKNADRDTITYNWNKGWNCNSNQCIAVINRDSKTILVNTTFVKRSNELLMCIPDDYQVFLTDETIKNPNILSTGELAEVIKTHTKHLVKRFVEQRLSEFYNILQNKKIVAHRSISDVFSHSKKPANSYRCYSCVNYDIIYDFVKKHNVKAFDWYNIPLYDTLNVENYIGWSKRNWLTIKCPSVKAIIDNKVFNKQDKVKLEQSYFYGLYCRGYGISRKELEARWNDDYNEAELKTLFDKRNIDVDLTNKTNLVTWKDGIELYAKSVKSNIEKALESNIRKSTENYYKAVNAANGLNYEERLNNWRMFSSFIRFNSRVEYDEFIVDSHKYGTGHWKKAFIYPIARFDNIQLRYRKDKNNSKYDAIETSANASVTLDQAIKMYKLYKVTIAKDNPQIGTIIKHDFSNKTINVGLYNLKNITYRQKQTNSGILLDKWEYVVVIGCHHIWIDDFMNFIRYYNLEDKFGIN